MDATAKRHYVSRVIDLTRIPALRLLILISALITGLTGLIAGQPAVARGGEPTVIAAALAGRIEQAGEAAQTHALPGVAISYDDARRDDRIVAAVFVPQTHKVDERRIE